MTQLFDPAEITNAIRSNLEGFTPDLTESQVGRVTEVGDGIARIAGLPNCPVNALLEFESGVRGLALNLDADSIGAVILGEADDDARARGQARDYLTSNRALVAHVGRKGISPALERIMGDLSDRAKVRERGASEILKAKAFASHGPIEQLLQKLKAAFLRGWNGSGGDQELDRVRKRLGRMRTSQIGS